MRQRMSIEIHIVQGPLEPIPADWRPAGAGAVVWFEGIVRPAEEGQPIAGLDYQAYQPMASRTLEQLARELLAQHALEQIVVEHSQGQVPAGKCSFRLRIASRHRKAAIMAMDQFIDRMKQDVPIWKSPVPAPGGGA